MNLNHLKPAWRRYVSSVAAREERTVEELSELLPAEEALMLSGQSFLLLKNAAMCALIIFGCGGC